MLDRENKKLLIFVGQLEILSINRLSMYDKCITFYHVTFIIGTIVIAGTTLSALTFCNCFDTSMKYGEMWLAISFSAYKQKGPMKGRGREQVKEKTEECVCVRVSQSEQARRKLIAPPRVMQVNMCILKVSVTSRAIVSLYFRLRKKLILSESTSSFSISLVCKSCRRRRLAFFVNRS